MARAMARVEFDHRLGDCVGEQAVEAANKSALPDVHARWERDRHWHSSDRITVEHALADHKRWRQLIRWIHRRHRLPDTHRAIAGLVSDRTATT
jgi:hypothetical protein